MKKIIVITLLLALIATSTKPMRSRMIADFKSQILSEIEDIKLEKVPDWNEFDNKVNPWLQQLDKLGPAGKQAATNYRTQINNLQLVAVLEINIQQLRSDIEEYKKNWSDGKIRFDGFTVKPFIEKVQKLEKDLPSLAPQEIGKIKISLNKTKVGIGIHLQMNYVKTIIDQVKKRLDIVQYIEQDSKTKEHAIKVNNRIVNNVKLLDYAIKRGLRGNMNFTDYFVMAIGKKAKQQYVVEFKTAVLNLIKTMVDDWEAIMDVIKDDKKDKEMRKDLASNAGKSLAFAIKMVERNFAKYLDDPKFKSAKGNDHLFINPEDYTNLMKAEADKL